MQPADAGRRLIRALQRAANAAGVEICWELLDTTPWNSALFVGERLALAGRSTPVPALDAFLAALPEMEFRLPGACVADLVIERPCASETCAFRLQALVIES